MNADAPVLERGLFPWIIRRNPAYLISACLTAAGARLFLASPANAASDIQFIIVTLCVLQIYEWAVGAILLALHRFRRSPEDQPSLFLVATAFWTGPIAATIEMIALRPQMGTYLAAAACIIALVELRACCRILNIRLSLTAQVVGSACVVLLAAAAPLLKIPESDSHLNEIVLYATWWVVAGLALVCLAAIPEYRRRSNTRSLSESASAWKQEALFLLITFVATGVHLTAMNYGFFCHAEIFYASPLIVASSIIGMRLLPTDFKWRAPVLALFGLLPGIAILMALTPFDEEFPIKKLPGWMRDPFICISLIAGAAWWFGFWRHRSAILLHAGCAALALIALRLTKDVVIEQVRFPRTMALAFLYGTAAYLAAMAWLFRSRWEILAALIVHLASTVVLVWQKTPADSLIVCLVTGWSALVGLHVSVRRPKLRWRIFPIAFLAISPWTLETASIFQKLIVTHAFTLIVTLFIAGQIWRWTRYRLVASLLLIGHFILAAADWTMKSGHPLAATLVLAGFAVLAAGAVISWNKRLFLDLLGPQPPSIVSEPTIQ